MLPFPSAMLQSSRAITDAFTVLLIGADGVDGATTFVDESPSAHTITAVGNAQIDTAQKKFGTGSLLLDGTGDGLSLPLSTTLEIRSGPFTIEFWARFALSQSSVAVMGHYHSGTSGIGWAISFSSGRFRFRGAQNLNIYDTDALFSPTVGQWHHFAVDRNAADLLRIYVDGVVLASSTVSATFNPPVNGLKIGYYDSTGLPYFNGNMDEIRISKGIARYNGAFTPPAAPFPR